MTDFMVLFQFTDEDGMHRAALFPETYEQARIITIFLVFGNSAQAQIYKWNNKNEEYEFLEKWHPEQTMKGD